MRTDSMWREKKNAQEQLIRYGINMRTIYAELDRENAMNSYAPIRHSRHIERYRPYMRW